MYIILDCAGNPWGPFATAEAAVLSAHSMWPEQRMDERDPPHKEGWTVVALREPETDKKAQHDARASEFRELQSRPKSWLRYPSGPTKGAADETEKKPR